MHFSGDLGAARGAAAAIGIGEIRRPASQIPISPTGSLAGDRASPRRTNPEAAPRARLKRVPARICIAGCRALRCSRRCPAARSPFRSPAWNAVVSRPARVVGELLALDPECRSRYWIGTARCRHRSQPRCRSVEVVRAAVGFRKHAAAGAPAASIPSQAVVMPMQSDVSRHGWRHSAITLGPGKRMQLQTGHRVLFADPRWHGWSAGNALRSYSPGCRQHAVVGVARQGRRAAQGIPTPSAGEARRPCPRLRIATPGGRFLRSATRAIRRSSNSRIPMGLPVGTEGGRHTRSPARCSSRNRALQAVASCPARAAAQMLALAALVLSSSRYCAWHVFDRSAAAGAPGGARSCQSPQTPWQQTGVPEGEQSPPTGTQIKDSAPRPAIRRSRRRGRCPARPSRNRRR